MVDAVLVVGRELPPILLTRTLAPGDVFSSDEAGIVDADVSISFDKRRVGYTAGDPVGAYLPGNLGGAPHIVEPNTIYVLEVETREGESIFAWTLTPTPASNPQWVLLSDDGTEVQRTLTTFAEASNDSVFALNRLIYSRGLLEARFTRPDVPAFVVGLFSRDLGSDYVIDPDFFDPEDFEDLERIGTSPPITGADGTLRLPWFAIYFEGRYVVKVFAMDRNWYDLARSAPELAGGSPGFGGPAGDFFERPIFHIEGGIGLFGSATVDSIGFYILPEDGQP